MELIMTIICYLTVIGCVLLLPFLLFAALRYGAEKSCYVPTEVDKI